MCIAHSWLDPLVLALDLANNNLQTVLFITKNPILDGRSEFLVENLSGFETKENSNANLRKQIMSTIVLIAMWTSKIQLEILIRTCD